MRWLVTLLEGEEGSVVECEPLPSLHVERGEGLERSLAREELEAALRVFDPSHTEEPHQEVEAIHEERTEHRSLWQRHNRSVI